MRFLQRTLTERPRIQTSAGNVEIRVERAVRFNFQRQTDFSQSIDHNTATFQQLLTAFLAHGQRFRSEARKRRMLGGRMRAQEEVGGEVVHGFERVFRHDHPTEAPAGHAEELGEAGADDGVRIAGEHGFHVRTVRFAVGQVKVSFVDDAPCTAFFRQVAHGFQGVEGDGGTGRVRRRGDHHRFGAIRPVFAAQFRCEMESGGCVRRHVHDFAAERADQFAIARIRRVGDQHFVTLVHRQCGGKQQCRGTSGRDCNTFRIDIHMVAFLVEIGNRLT